MAERAPDDVSPAPPKCFNDNRDYERDVLGLEEGQTEHDLDEEYIQDAQDCGLEPPASSSPAKDSGSSWLSTNTTSTGPRRRSGSSESHRSASTGLTSNLSINSTDQYFAQLAQSPTNPHQQPYALRFHNLSRPSLLEMDFDETSVPPTPRSQSSVSLSAPNSPQSTVSLPLAHDSPRKPFSMRHSFGRISKLKKTSKGTGDTSDSLCYLCSKTDTHNNRAGAFFPLPCHHTICRSHLRQLVFESLKSGQRRPPQCCGRSFPRAAVQAVTREDEEERLFPPPPRPPPPRLSSAPKSPLAQETFPDNHLKREWHKRDSASANSAMEVPVTEEAHRNLRCAMADTKFKALRRMHEEQRNQFLRYMSKQQESLSTYHNKSRALKLSRHAQAMRELEDGQPTILTKLEDKHVAAEIDLREAQSQEKRNCLLKLRHMEAYCNGHGPDGTMRTVTEQDRKELERQYWLRDHLDHRHEAAINVLREQQARQVRLCAQKQETEVVTRKQKHEKDMVEFEKSCEAEAQEFEELFGTRKQRLMRRWVLAAEIWKKHQADDGILELPFPIAPIEWPSDTHPDAIALAY